MNAEKQKILSELGKTQFGKVLKEFLEEELKKIDTVYGVVTLEEALGRQRACELINKLFSFLAEKDSSQREKNQYV